MEHDVKSLVKDWLKRGFKVAVFESKSLLDYGDKFYAPLEESEATKMTKGQLVMKPKKMTFIKFIDKVPT
jgi:hypothetical protein